MCGINLTHTSCGKKLITNKPFVHQKGENEDKTRFYRTIKRGVHEVKKLQKKKILQKKIAAPVVAEASAVLFRSTRMYTAKGDERLQQQHRRTIIGGSSVRELEDHMNPDEFTVGLGRKEQDRVKKLLAAQQKNKKDEEESRKNNKNSSSKESVVSPRSHAAGGKGKEADLANILTEVEAALLHVVRKPNPADLVTSTHFTVRDRGSNLLPSPQRKHSSTLPMPKARGDEGEDREQESEESEENVDGNRSRSRRAVPGRSTAKTVQSDEIAEKDGGEDDSPPEVYLSDFLQEQQQQQKLFSRRRGLGGRGTGGDDNNRNYGGRGTQRMAWKSGDVEMLGAVEKDGTQKGRNGDESNGSSKPSGKRTARLNSNNSANGVERGTTAAKIAKLVNKASSLDSAECDEIIELIMFCNDLMKHDLFSLMELFSTPFEEECAVEKFSTRWGHILKSLASWLFPDSQQNQQQQQQQVLGGASSASRPTTSNNSRGGGGGSGSGVRTSQEESGLVDERPATSSSSPTNKNAPTVSFKTAVVASTFSAKLLSRVRGSGTQQAGSLEAAFAEAQAELNGQMTTVKALQTHEKFTFLEGIRGVVRSSFQYTMEELALRHQEKYQNRFSFVSLNDAMFKAIGNATEAQQHAIKMEAQNKLLISQLETAQKQIASMKESNEENVQNYYKELMQVRQKMLDLQQSYGDNTRVAELFEHPSREVKQSNGGIRGGKRAIGGGSPAASDQRGELGTGPNDDDGGEQQQQQHLQYVNRKLTVECAVLNHTLIQRDNVIRALEREVEKSRGEIARARRLASEALIQDETVDATLEEAGKMMDVIETLRARTEVLEGSLEGKDGEIKEAESKMYSAKAKLALMEAELEAEKKKVSDAIDKTEKEREILRDEAQQAKQEVERTVDKKDRELLDLRTAMLQLRHEHQEELEINFKLQEEANKELERLSRQLLETKRENETDLTAKDVLIAERDQIIVLLQGELEHVNDESIREGENVVVVRSFSDDGNDNTDDNDGERGATETAGDNKVSRTTSRTAVKSTAQSRPTSATSNGTVQRRKSNKSSHNNNVAFFRTFSRNSNQSYGSNATTSEQEALAVQAMKERSEADRIAFANEHSAKLVAAMTDLESEKSGLQLEFEMERGKWQSSRSKLEIEAWSLNSEVKLLDSHVSDVVNLFESLLNDSHGDAMDDKFRLVRSSLASVRSKFNNERQRLRQTLQSEIATMEDANDLALRKLIIEKQKEAQRSMQERLQKLSIEEMAGARRSPFGTFLPMEHELRNAVNIDHQPLTPAISTLTKKSRRGEGTNTSGASSRMSSPKATSVDIVGALKSNQLDPPQIITTDPTHPMFDDSHDTHNYEFSDVTPASALDLRKKAMELLIHFNLLSDAQTSTIEEADERDKEERKEGKQTKQWLSPFQPSPQRERAVGEVGDGDDGSSRGEKQIDANENSRLERSSKRSLSISSALSNVSHQRKSSVGAARTRNKSARLKQLDAALASQGAGGSDAYLIAQLRAEITKLRTQLADSTSASKLSAPHPSVRRPTEADVAATLGAGVGETSLTGGMGLKKQEEGLISTPRENELLRQQQQQQQGRSPLVARHPPLESNKGTSGKATNANHFNGLQLQKSVFDEINGPFMKIRSLQQSPRPHQRTSPRTTNDKMSPSSSNSTATAENKACVIPEGSGGSSRPLSPREPQSGNKNALKREDNNNNNGVRITSSTAAAAGTGPLPSRPSPRQGQDEEREGQEANVHTVPSKKTDDNQEAEEALRTILSGNNIIKKGNINQESDDPQRKPQERRYASVTGVVGRGPPTFSSSGTVSSPTKATGPYPPSSPSFSESGGTFTVMKAPELTTKLSKINNPLLSANNSYHHNSSSSSSSSAHHPLADFALNKSNLQMLQDLPPRPNSAVTPTATSEKRRMNEMGTVSGSRFKKGAHDENQINRAALLRSSEHVNDSGNGVVPPHATVVTSSFASRPSSAPPPRGAGSIGKATAIPRRQLVPVVGMQNSGSSAANRLRMALSESTSAGPLVSSSGLFGGEGSNENTITKRQARMLTATESLVAETIDLFPGLEAAAEHYDLFECVAKLKLSCDQLIEVCEDDTEVRRQQEEGLPTALHGEDTELFVRNQILIKFNIFRNLDSVGAGLLNRLSKKRENILRRREDQLEGVLGAIQNISLTHPKEAKLLRNQLNGKRTMSAGRRLSNVVGAAGGGRGVGRSAASNISFINGNERTMVPLPVMQMELVPKPRPRSAMDISSIHNSK